MIYLVSVDDVPLGNLASLMNSVIDERFMYLIILLLKILFYVFDLTDSIDFLDCFCWVGKLG